MKLQFSKDAGPAVPPNVTVPDSVKFPGTGGGAEVGVPGITPPAVPLALKLKDELPVGLHDTDVKVNVVLLP